MSIRMDCHLTSIITTAMKTQDAQETYTKFLEKLGKAYCPDRVKDGQFGAMMDVELVNDGPVTITIDTADLVAPNQVGKSDEA